MENTNSDISEEEYDDVPSNIFDNNNSLNAKKGGLLRDSFNHNQPASWQQNRLPYNIVKKMSQAQSATSSCSSYDAVK